MSLSRKIIFSAMLMIVHLSTGAQSFRLFAPEVKTDYPSVVYDFLERYLFELDSLERKGVPTQQKISDDKVIFLKGTAITASEISADMMFTMDVIDGKRYRVSWSDTSGNTLLEMAFPMSYELILGKSKHVIEAELKSVLQQAPDYKREQVDTSCLVMEDGCYTQEFKSHYYIESLSVATYYTKDPTGIYKPVFTADEKWHSASNLFLGAVEDIAEYTILIQQNLYGFKKETYRVPLSKWLGYCQAMQMTTYFAVEEEREDGIKALLIAQSPDLGFNHVLSVIIPDDFLTDKKSLFKATLNAYIPTQNVKDLYQQYVDKPKKKYE